MLWKKTVTSSESRWVLRARKKVWWPKEKKKSVKTLEIRRIFKEPFHWQESWRHSSRFPGGFVATRNWAKEPNFPTKTKRFKNPSIDDWSLTRTHWWRIISNWLPLERQKSSKLAFISNAKYPHATNSKTWKTKWPPKLKRRAISGKISPVYQFSRMPRLSL